MIRRNIKPGRECNHPTCGPTCRRPAKKGIDKVAAGKVELQQQFKNLSLWYRLRNRLCKIKSPNCNKWTEGVHHRKGKVGYDDDGTPMLIAIRWFTPACNACNRYVEHHPEWAIKHGHSVSRLY